MLTAKRVNPTAPSLSTFQPTVFLFVALSITVVLASARCETADVWMGKRKMKLFFLL